MNHILKFIKLFLLIPALICSIHLYSRDSLNHVINGDFELDSVNWHVFATTDMINYTDHGAKLSYTDFSWASGNAFAGHCVYKNGKFWWYVPMTHKTIKVN